MECKNLIKKEELKAKAKGVWKSLTEDEIEIKLTVTPLGIIAAAAGVGATICAIRALHKMDVKRALKKQAQQFAAADVVEVAEAEEVTEEA